MFRKRVDSLTFHDVVAFLEEQREEGIHLDYKSTVPAAEKIAKLAAAFANSEGGFIVFGASEENELPTRPFLGGDLGNDARQRVKQACNEHLVPPISPIVGQVLRNSDDPSKGYMVVAIPQSGSGPHVSKSDGKVYVKVLDHKEPVHPTLVQYERIRTSESNRDQMIRRCATEMQSEWNVLNPPSPGGSDALQNVAMIELALFRTFPDGRDLASPQQLIAAFEEYRVTVSDPYLHAMGVPVAAAHQLRVYERGISSRTQDDIKIATAIHVSGAFLARAAIPTYPNQVHFPGEGTLDVQMIPGESVCALAIALMRAGLRCLQTFGCYSTVTSQFWITHRSSGGICLPHPDHADQRAGLRGAHVLGPARPNTRFETALPWASRVTASEVEQELARRFVSSFNLRDEQTTRAFINEAISRVKTELD